MTGGRRERGMTLVEVMVALALLSLLAVGILSAFSLGERSYRQIVRVDYSSRDIALAQRFLRGVLESAYPSEPGEGEGMQRRRFGLEGESDMLAVTAPMPISGGTGGMRRFEILLQEQGDGSKDLIVRSGPDGSSSEAPAHDEVLIERVLGVQWNYLEPADPDAMQIRPEPTWIDRWTATRRPPGLVRLRVFFPPADPRVWPELIAAPRISDDANCEFDVIAMACREGRS